MLCTSHPDYFEDIINGTLNREVNAKMLFQGLMANSTHSPSHKASVNIKECAMNDVKYCYPTVPDNFVMTEGRLLSPSQQQIVDIKTELVIPPHF